MDQWNFVIWSDVSFFVLDNNNNVVSLEGKWGMEVIIRKNTWELRFWRNHEGYVSVLESCLVSLRGSIEGPKSKTQRLNELRTLRGRQVSSRRYRVVMELIAGSGRNRGLTTWDTPCTWYQQIAWFLRYNVIQREPAFSLCVSNSRQGIFNPDYVYEREMDELSLNWRKEILFPTNYW